MMDISIKDCRRALQFALAHHRKGFPFIAQRSWIVVSEPLEVRGKNWISGELVLRRPEKVAFTAAARKLIADEVIKVNPRAFPAEISSQECLKAIEFAGELSITHRGETLHVTELVVRKSRWWCGDCRLSPAKQRLLTQAAREALSFEQHVSAFSKAEQDRRYRIWRKVVGIGQRMNRG